MSVGWIRKGIQAVARLEFSIERGLRMVVEWTFRADGKG